MAKIDLLRKIIREEVEKAIRKEMPEILREIKMTSQDTRTAIKESKKAVIPGTLNTQPFIPAKAVQFRGSDPLSQMLNETATNMAADESSYAFNSDDVMADPMSFFQPQEASVGSVNGMLQSARGSSAPELVQINEVPDFTQLMSKMMAKGIM